MKTIIKKGKNVQARAQINSAGRLRIVANSHEPDPGWVNIGATDADRASRFLQQHGHKKLTLPEALAAFKPYSKRRFYFHLQNK